MKRLNILSMTCLAVFFLMQGCSTPQSDSIEDYPITPVDFTHVQLHEGFWKDWVSTVRAATIPFAIQKCQETGRIDNFVFAGGIKEGKFQGNFGFNDSDLYKIMEGAAYALMIENDPELAAYLDTLVYYVSEAQEEDGYLYTAWTLKANDYTDFYCCTYSDQGKWIETQNSSHEFYNVGHMYEAAVAHHLATGNSAFLDVAVKNADLIYDVCITQGNNYVPGHQEIEIGLAKLYRVTGDARYLQLAKHLLDIRADVLDVEYSQAHQPVTDQTEAVGHAVRANYMYSAMADVAALTGDSAYLVAIGKLWDNVVEKKLSITGGVGAIRQGEAYGANYELPNHPYNETCAAIANVYWNHRMFLLHGDVKYMDVLERSLYNGVISGLSLDGTLFFYPNTLQHDGVASFNQGVNGRSPWFSCSCCPSNLSRFIPSVAGYAFAVKGNDVYVNLYMNSTVTVPAAGGDLKLALTSSYPWDGNIGFEVLNEKALKAKLFLRVPGWARDEAVPSDLFCFGDSPKDGISVNVNGKDVEPIIEQGYVILPGKWKKGDRIRLMLPMEDRIIEAHDKVEAKTGLLAVQYGPIVYCAEEIDNTSDVLEAGLEVNSQFSAQYREDLLGGVNILKGEELNLVPYYAWANREVGKMNVWFKQTDRPNIVFILADDLGYGDLGCYGQERIETPNIDRLAEGGMRFTQHYSGSAVCAPSRCVLLTGKHSGHAYIRGNDEWGDRGDVWDYRAMITDSTLEGQRPLPAETITLGKLLQSRGYKTGMIGKWGLGAPHSESIPTWQGFNFFCGYNCQRQAHTYYPVHLYRNENRLHLDNDTVAPHARLEPGADPFDPESYTRFNLSSYAPDVMFEEMINFIERNSEDPFFLYWASPIPHVALQAPEHWVDYYVQKFGDEKPYRGDRGYFPHRYPHAAYAAMVSYLDDLIGELVAILKKKGLYNNTLIMFSSDNGPSFNGGIDSPWFSSAGPFKSERGWAKGYLHEGGIRVPMIASWPGNIESGSESDHISAFWDLLPTLCEVAGAEIPEDVDGVSFLPELKGEGDQQKHPYLYWEFPAYGGQQAVRMGPWKALRRDIKKGNLEIELYNLDTDLQEERNVAAAHPELIEEIEDIMKKEHEPAHLESFRMKALGDVIPE